MYILNINIQDILSKGLIMQEFKLKSLKMALGFALFALSTTQIQAAVGYEGASSSADVVKIDGVEKAFGSVSDGLSKGVSSFTGSTDMGGMSGMAGDAMSGMTGGNSSVSSSVSTNPASMDTGSIVTGYCTTTMPIATQASLVSSTNWLNSAIGTQISNATNVLSNTITSEVQKASKLNTETLNKGQTIKEKQFEAEMQFKTRVMKDKDKIETDRKLSEDMDVGKLNKTNVCAQPGTVFRQGAGERISAKVAGGMGLAQRGFNRAMKGPLDVSKIHKPLYDDKRMFDELAPVTSTAPKVLTEEELAKVMYRNSLLSNSRPAPELRSAELEKTADGKKYVAFKAIHEQKVEAIQNVFNADASLDAPTISLEGLNDAQNPLKIMGVAEEVDTGKKDKNGNPIKIKSIVNNKTSSSVWFDASVAQYHLNTEWQKSIATASSSTKLEEVAKISALNVDINYKIYKQLRLTNKLLALMVQKDVGEESVSLTKIASDVQGGR